VIKEITDKTDRSVLNSGFQEIPYRNLSIQVHFQHFKIRQPFASLNLQSKNSLKKDESLSRVHISHVLNEDLLTAIRF